MYDYSISNFLLPQHFDSSVPPVAGVFASPPPPPPFQDQLATHAFDSIRKALAALKSEGANNNILPSPSSLPPYLQRPIVIQRSASSHSLQKDVYHPFSSPCEEESMRKVFSTGDLQILNSLQHSQRSGSPLGHESCSQDGVPKVGRYSPEERRERIERYRSKRNQRNFHKKIKYACRKTLADSRPRIRGRFARNDEMGECSQSRWSQAGGEDDEEDDDGWINFLDSISMNLIP